jgi:hypothetical protein
MLGVLTVAEFDEEINEKDAYLCSTSLHASFQGSEYLHISGTSPGNSSSLGLHLQRSVFRLSDTLRSLPEYRLMPKSFHHPCCIFRTTALAESANKGTPCCIQDKKHHVRRSTIYPQIPKRTRRMCGGWDSNPWIPTEQGPKPCAFSKLGNPRLPPLLLPAS